MNYPSVASRSLGRRILAIAAASLIGASFASPAQAQQTAARQWNEMLIASIRKDQARPPIHARNLYHIAVAMWDAWATYDTTANCVLFGEKHPSNDPNVDAFRSEALSFAVYDILRARFALSPGAAVMFPQYDALMTALGYNKNFTGTIGNTPAAIGNRIANAVLSYGLGDNANEQGNYANQFYAPVNPPLVPPLPGNPTMIDPNRWQPLALDFFIDQSGTLILGGYPAAIGPEWGKVKPFSLTLNDQTLYYRDNTYWPVYHDQGSEPLYGNDPVQTAQYKWSHELVSTWSSHLDPADGVMWDISPGAIGGAVLPASVADYPNFYDKLNGGDNGHGHPVNPVTGQPYAPQIVPRGDYTRVLAEFWADGPTSETPPGHWFTILNKVMDDPLFTWQLEGTGPVLPKLEFEVKAYLTLGGAMHDVAIACWGAKGWYDSSRPVSALRYMADRGQCTNPALPSYNTAGIDLIPGYIEVVTAADTVIGGKFEQFAGSEGKIAVKAWKGPPYIINPAIDVAGVDWILAENWWPYQRPSFVSPPFPGYMSGHSTYSRTGAIIMDKLTGTPFFPGGLGTFFCPQNQYLVFEDGPSVNVTLQWATYYDASDQCSLSRIWGGIHPPMDDIPGRNLGNKIGPEAFNKAKEYWSGSACPVKDAIATYGTGCAGFGSIVPKLTAAGCATPNGNVTLQIGNTKPQTISLLLFGFLPNNLPLAGGCSLLVAPIVQAIPLPLGGTVGVPGSGSASFTSTIPGAALTGSSVKLQALVADNTNFWGYSATNGLSVTIK